MNESSPIPQIIFAVPPGGRMLADERSGQRNASLPLWIYWLQIANRHAGAAERASQVEKPLSLEKARQTSAAGRPVAGPEGNVEMIEAMVAISAAANVIDAVFGSLQQVDPWKPAEGRKRTTARAGEILEQLKHSFVIGKHAKDWSRELDWLFQVRHSIVHHSEQPRPMEIASADSQHIVLSATEAYSLTATAARRAASFVDHVVNQCLDRPREASRHWSERARIVKRNMGPIPGPSGPPPTIDVTSTDGGVEVKANPGPGSDL